MKWLEVPAPEILRIAKRTDVVLLPMGSIESHGPHMPSGVDSYRAEGVCVEAAKLEEAVVLPCLHYNSCAAGKPLPGSALEPGDAFISFPPSLVMAILRQVCLEAARIGFGKVIVVRGHGPSSIALNLLQSELQEEAQPLHRAGRPAPIVFWTSVTELTQETMRRMGIDSNHGSDGETSLTAACAPGLVDLDMAAQLEPHESQSKAIPELQYIHNWNRMAPKGYIGNPAAATLEKGRALLKAGAEALAELIGKVKKYDLSRDV